VKVSSFIVSVHFIVRKTWSEFWHCFCFVSPNGTSFFVSLAEVSDADRKTSPNTKIEFIEGGRHLMLQLMKAMWLLHQAHPANMALAPVCVPG
jgi:hypothetical protein